MTGPASAVGAEAGPVLSIGVLLVQSHGKHPKISGYFVRT